MGPLILRQYASWRCLGRESHSFESYPLETTTITRHKGSSSKGLPTSRARYFSRFSVSLLNSTNPTHGPASQTQLRARTESGT